MKQYYTKHIMTLIMTVSISIAAMAHNDDDRNSKRLPVASEALDSDSLSSFSKSMLSANKSKYTLSANTPKTYSASKLLYNGKNLIPGRTVATQTRSVMFADAQLNEKYISDVKIYPNPVNDAFTVSYNLRTDNQVTIKLMDLLGNEIETLISQRRMNAGSQELTFNLNDSLQKGFYFVRLTVGNESVMKRIAVL